MAILKLDAFVSWRQDYEKLPTCRALRCAKRLVRDLRLRRGTMSDNGGGFLTSARYDAYHSGADTSCYTPVRFRIGECLEDAGVDFIVCESLE